ncbi:MAG: amidohydrolase [Oscillospiraceae bacterium]|nr:amidohydrolase [Oscillospiraceae bacterium]
MDAIEKRILEIIDQRAEDIIAFGDDIWYHAELGFQEFRTAEKVAEALRGLGLDPKTGLAITGVKAYLKPKAEGELNVCLMGEMDALPIPNHPDANPETGAAHACGHNAQITGVIGAAMALTDPEVRAALGGNVTFFGVPNEEMSTDMPYKKKLRDEGKLHFFGGKQQLIYERQMDDLDIVVGHHIMPGEFGSGNTTSSGIIEKDVKYIGRSAHTSGNPDLGIDAQMAAVLAMHNVDCQREGFKEGRWQRVHGNFVKVGTAHNVVADDVRLEFGVRGKTLADMKDAAWRVQRALEAAAIATGCGAEIETIAGYLPVVPLDEDSVTDVVFGLIDPTKKVKHWPKEEDGGTCDYGDVSSCVAPTYQLYTNGTEGNGHSPDYRIVDKTQYYINTAKMFALMAYELLKDNAKKAKEVVANNKPPMTIEEYIAFQDSCMTTDYIEMKPVPDYRKDEKK